MAGSERITLAREGTLDLAPKVVVGIVDIAAAGARVLLSMEPPFGWTVRETALQVQGLQPPTSGASTSGSSSTLARGDSGSGVGHRSDGGTEDGSTGLLRPVLAVAGGTTTQQGADAAAAAASSSSSFALAPSPSPAAVLLRNFYPPAPAAGGSSGSPQVSLLALNAVVPDGVQGELAAAILALVEGRGLQPAAAAAAAGEKAEPEAAAGSKSDDGGSAAASEVTVVAAMLLQQVVQPAALYQHLINRAEPLDPELPPLQPPSAAASAAVAASSVGGSSGPAGGAAAARVRDGQLAALLHVLEVSGTPTTCLLAPGHKPPAATSLDLPGSAAACDALGAALARAFGLRYDAEKCRTLRALYKWFVPERAAGSDVMYM